MQFGSVDNIILFGSGELLLNTAAFLRAKNIPTLVVTSPRHAAESAFESKTFREVLAEQRYEFLVVEDLEEFDLTRRIGQSTAGLSVGAAWIFKKAIIEKFKGRLFNVHGARLPQDRGGGGFSWLIMRGLYPSCCVVHQITPKLDDGAMVMVKEFCFPAHCRIPADFGRFSLEQNKIFVSEFLTSLLNKDDFGLIQQPEYLSSYWPRLSTEHHGHIDWSWSLRQIERFICAFDEPYQGASTFWRGKRVFLKGCLATSSDGIFHPFQAGIVYRKSPAGLFIAANDGSLVVSSVKAQEGSDVMILAQVGDRFYTPSTVLDRAEEYRAIYTPKGLKAQI